MLACGPAADEFRGIGHSPDPFAGKRRSWVAHIGITTSGPCLAVDPPGPATRQARRYFLFLRWTRVLRSSLRCFFFAIRLRRFLITEPTEPPSIDTHAQRRT